MKPYEGVMEDMRGPNRYGYVNPNTFFYGEHGGRYVDGWAIVSKEAKKDGEPCIPVWSDESGDIWVALPSDFPVSLMGEKETQGFVWVHRISRAPEFWGSAFHPVFMQSPIMQEMLKLSEETNKLALTHQNDLMDTYFFRPKIPISVRQDLHIVDYADHIKMPALTNEQEKKFKKVLDELKSSMSD